MVHGIKVNTIISRDLVGCMGYNEEVPGVGQRPTRKHVDRFSIEHLKVMLNIPNTGHWSTPANQCQTSGGLKFEAQ